MRRASTWIFAGLLDCIESAKSGITGGGEDHISAFADLRKRDLFSLSRIVPGGVSHANIVLNHPHVRVRGLRTLLVPAFKAMNQTDVHAADKAEDVRLGRHARNHADEI